jgi:hypothetical protein
MPSALAHVTIVDLDRNRKAIEAQFNPKEIQVDKTAAWSATAVDKGNHPELTFTSSNARTLTLELFFDTYESGRDVHATYVAHLVHLMDVIDPDSQREDQKRPPKLRLVWGDKLPPFIGVLESVTTKYTMFLPDGTPVRATCSVKLLEGDRMSWKRAAR